jgi:hypothetical protein
MAVASIAEAHAAARFAHPARWRRLARPCVLLALALLASGCPEERNAPEPPPDAQRCESFRDCNDNPCGALRACVGGLCESAQSLVVPCLDGARSAADGGRGHDGAVGRPDAASGGELGDAGP